MAQMSITGRPRFLLTVAEWHLALQQAPRIEPGSAVCHAGTAVAARLSMAGAGCDLLQSRQTQALRCDASELALACPARSQSHAEQNHGQ